MTFDTISKEEDEGLTNTILDAIHLPRNGVMPTRGEFFGIVTQTSLLWKPFAGMRQTGCVDP